MTKYNVKIFDITVHEWNEDGQGDHVCNKSGYTLASVAGISEARDAINEFFGNDVNSDDCLDGYMTATVIEDEETTPCDNGKFMVDYCFGIEETKLVKFTEKL